MGTLPGYYLIDHTTDKMKNSVSMRMQKIMDIKMLKNGDVNGPIPGISCQYSRQ